MQEERRDVMKIRFILFAIPNAFIWVANIMRFMVYNPPPEIGPKIDGFNFDDDYKYLR